MTKPLVLVGNVGRYGGGGPRYDFDEIASAISGEVFASSSPAAFKGLLRLGHWPLAYQARAHEPSLVVSLSEKVGLAVALAHPRRTPQVVVAHRLTTPRRRRFQQITRWLRRVDRVIVLSRPQEAYLRDEVGLSAQRVRFVYDKVDHDYFSPRRSAGEGYVLSVGQSGRDYATLVRAVEVLGVPTVIVASSPWGGGSRPAGIDLPRNVTLRHDVSFSELRDLYDRASVAVVPLLPALDFAAGVNAVLEAMAMRKPLIVTSTPGLSDYVVDGEDARLTPPGDPPALGSLIRELLTDHAQADALAARGRQVVESGRNLDRYAGEVATIAAEVVTR